MFDPFARKGTWEGSLAAVRASTEARLRDRGLRRALVRLGSLGVHGLFGSALACAGPAEPTNLDAPGGIAGSSAVSSSGADGAATTAEAPWMVTFGTESGDDGESWSASFASYWATDPSAPCYTYSVDDNCDRFDCRVDGMRPAELSGPSAGPVTISAIGGDVVLVPDERGAASLRGEGSKWWPGDSVMMSAPGADLPSFDFGFVFPVRVVMLEPDLASLDAPRGIIDVRQPFELVWQPGSLVLQVEIRQEGSDAAIGTKALVCHYHGEDGQGFVRPAAMAGFATGPTAPETRLGVSFIHGHERIIGGRTLSVVAHNRWAGFVTLEATE